MNRSAFLVILPIAAIWIAAACSEDMTNAIAPDTRVLNPSSSTAYLVSFAGDVDTDPNPARGHTNVGKSGGVVMGRQHGQESFILRKAFADLADPTGQCFPRGSGDYVNPFTLDEGGSSRGFAGGFSSEKKNPNVVVGGYYFDALGKDGTSSFSYFLRIEGTVTSGTFPPDPGMSVTVSWNGVATLSTEGKGKGSKGGNEGSACVGEFAVSGGATITGVE